MQFCTMLFCFFSTLVVQNVFQFVTIITKVVIQRALVSLHFQCFHITLTLLPMYVTIVNVALFYINVPNVILMAMFCQLL